MIVERGVRAARTSLVLMEMQHIFEPGRFFEQCHASTLAVLEDGTLLCAWFAGSHEGAEDVAIWSARRDAAGIWSEPTVLAAVPGVPCWNPVLFAHVEAGRELVDLYFKVGRDIPGWRTWRQRSADGGRSWSLPELLVADDSFGRGPVRNPPLLTQAGTLLAPASRETKTSWDAFVDRSRDGGASWEMVPILRERAKFRGLGLIQPTLWQGTDGRIHALLRSTEGRIFRSVSHDDGASWAVAWPTGLPNNNSGIAATRLESGEVLLVYNPLAGNWAPRSPLSLAISGDDGESWTDLLQLEPREPEAEYSYPAIVTRGDRVWISYTWRRRTIAFRELEIAGAGGV
ncbi:MAG: exo-alpha-sialidase [Bacillota bacterium]|nr:exo-alpha-sialidase [Bacillota bacterium]